MMDYGGGDLLRTGAVWRTVGSLPRPVCRLWAVACVAPGPWRERIRGGLTARPPAWPPAFGVHEHDDALYKSTTFTFHLLSHRLFAWYCRL